MTMCIFKEGPQVGHYKTTGTPHTHSFTDKHIQQNKKKA